MPKLTYERLIEACMPGGASVLTVVTELRPAAGDHAAVAPARYVAGTQPTYAFETRFVDGEAARCVLIDSKSSANNRVELALVNGIQDEDEVLVNTPRMEVTYASGSWLDLEVPHRFTDAHFRAGSVNGVPTTDDPTYRAARDASTADVRPVLELSPGSLVLGAWDSTRRSNQARYRSVLVGEVIGVLADQSASGRDIPRRGGARRDEIAPSVRLKGADLEALLVAQEPEMSPKTVDAIRKEIAKVKTGTVSASKMGLGSIPPSLDALGLVSCRRIIRSHVLSFSALRQLRFGGPIQTDVAGRALLAAYALYGLALANQELLLRANCDLVEASAPVVKLDGRNGAVVEIDSLTPDVVRPILAQAIAAAKAVGIRWEGQVYRVTGDTRIAAGVVADSDEAGE